MTTPPSTAERFRRAGGGDNTDGDAGEQGPPALAVDTNQDGLIDVQVQQPAEGQEADMMATPGQPRQALEALSGGEVYQPAVWEPDTPDQRGGAPTLRVGTSVAPASPASLMPAAPALRPPVVDVNGAPAGTLYAAGIGPSLQPMTVQVVPMHAAQVSMAVQSQVPLGSARAADLRLTASVGGSLPAVLRQPAAEYGAPGEVVVSAGYLDALTAQLQAAQDEIRYLREQLHPRENGYDSPTDAPDGVDPEDAEPVLVFDATPLKDAYRQQLAREVKDVVRTFQVKSDDPVAVIHSKVSQVLTRLGSVDGGKQYGDIAAEALQLVPNVRDQNAIQTDRDRKRLRHALNRLPLTSDDKRRLNDVSAIDRPGLQRQLQVMQVFKSHPLLQEIDKAAKLAFMLNCPSRYLPVVQGTSSWLQCVHLIVAEVGLTAQQQMQAMVQRLTVPRSSLMGDSPENGETKTVMLSLKDLQKRLLSEMAARTFVPEGAASITPFGMAAWTVAQGLLVPVDPSGPAQVFLPDVRKALYEQVGRHDNLESLASELQRIEDKVGPYQSTQKQGFKPPQPPAPGAGHQVVLAVTEAPQAEVRRAAQPDTPGRTVRGKAKWESQQTVEARLTRVGAELRGRPQQDSGRQQDQQRRPSLSPGPSLPASGRQSERNQQSGGKTGGQQRGRAEPEPARVQQTKSLKPCWAYNSDKGCSFGDSCRFTHGEQPLPQGRTAGRGQSDAGGRGQPHGGRPPATNQRDSRENRLDLHRVSGVKFVGKVSDERAWPTAREAAVLAAARPRAGLRKNRQLTPQCLPVALSVRDDVVGEALLPELLSEDEGAEGQGHVLSDMLEGKTLAAGTVLLDSCSATALMKHNLFEAAGRRSDMVLKGVGPDTVKAVHVVDITLQACFSYQNEPPATLPPIVVHTVVNMQESLLLSQGQLARCGCDFITPSGDTNEGYIILPPDHYGRRPRLRTKFNEHNLLVIDEPLRITSTTEANHSLGLSDTPVYHVNKAAYMLATRKPLPALQLANSFVIKVQSKPTTAQVAPVPALPSARQLRSATVRPPGQPSRSAGVAKSSSKCAASVHVKSVRVSVPKKVQKVSRPQVAPPTNSDIDAPVGEALVTVPAEPATFPEESSHEASPEVGEFQMQFSQLGDGEAAALESRNIRLTALLGAYELSAYVNLFLAAGYRWVTDFPHCQADLISECRHLFAQMRKPEWKRLVRAIVAQQRTLLAPVAAGPSAASSKSVGASAAAAQLRHDGLISTDAGGGSTQSMVSCASPSGCSVQSVESAELQPQVCVGCDAGLFSQPHVLCGSGLLNGDSPCVNGLHSTCCQRGSIATSDAWICSLCVVKLVTAGLGIPVGNVQHVYCIRAVGAPAEQQVDTKVESENAVLKNELGNKVLLKVVQRRYPGWGALSYADVVNVAACSKSLRTAIMGQSATTAGQLNPFTHLLPQGVLRSISPGESPKELFESIGGWLPGGVYSYAPKRRPEVFAVMATVAPGVSVFFTDKGTLSIRARSQRAPISLETANVIKKAQRLLQDRYGHGNYPGSVSADAICYRCCGTSKYDMQRCSAEGCTLHVHSLCVGHVPPRCWCPHIAAETDVGKSQPPALWRCARHALQDDFAERVASFRKRSLSSNPAYAFPREMCCESHNCPACLIQEVVQVGRGDRQVTTQRWWPKADDLQCLLETLARAGVDSDDLRGVVKVLSANNIHLGDLWKVSSTKLTTIGLDGYTAAIIVREARIHCAVMENLIELGGCNTRVPHDSACISVDYYQGSYNRFDKLQRGQERAQYDRERREAQLAFIQPVQPVPVFMMKKAAAPVTPAAATGSMQAPVPQAPRRRGHGCPVQYVTQQGGVLSSQILQGVDYVVVSTHCLGSQIGYSGDDAAVRRLLRYSDRFNPAVRTADGINVAEPGTVTVCYPQAPAREGQPGVVLMHASLFGGAPSIRVLSGKSDTVERRQTYALQCLQALAAALPEQAAVAFSSEFQPDGRSEHQPILEAWADRNPGLKVFVVSRSEPPQVRSAGPSRQGTGGHSGAGPSTPRDKSPSRRTDGSGQSDSRSTVERTSSAGAFQGSSGACTQRQMHRSMQQLPRPSSAAMPETSAADADRQGFRVPMCRFAERREACPYERRRGGCRYYHPPQSNSSTSTAVPQLPTSVDAAAVVAVAPTVPFMHSVIKGLPEMQYYLGIPPVVNGLPRQAGRRFLEQFDFGGDAAVIYEWGSKTFSVGAAIERIQGFYYVACDLYPPSHPQVVAMLARHNVAGTTAVYIQGQIGTAPSWQQLAKLLWDVWRLPLRNLRVYLASPECTTVSSAPQNRYSGRDAMNGFAPLSPQARLDDTTREAVMRTADDIATQLKIQGIEYTFTAIVEQPRSGIAAQVAAIKRRLMFGSWHANHMDNCQFADSPSSMKPSSFFTRGETPSYDITCRPKDGTGCAWRRSDGVHVVSIVDYNPSCQIRLPDGHVGRSLVHPLQYAALIAMALAGQVARQKHAAGFVDSGRVQMSVTSPALIHQVPVMTARIAGRVALLENTPLTAQQLHQATLHVDPRKVLRSIPSWSGFTIRAKSGTILAEPKIQLKDLNIEGTCDTCARGKLRATGSRHTSHQRDNCRRQRAHVAARESAAEQPEETPSRRSPRFTGMVHST